MKKNRNKLFAFLLAVPILLAACKMDINSKPNNDNNGTAQNENTVEKLVRINPILNLSARTVMPDLEGITLEDLQYTLSYSFMDGVTSGSSLGSSNMTYAQLTEPSTPFKVPEGNLKFTLTAYNTSKTLKFVSILENVDVVYAEGEEKDISFTLRPAKSGTYSNTVQTVVRINFPKESNPTFVEGKITAYYESGNVRDTYIINNSSEVKTDVDSDTECPYIELTKSVTMYNDYNYYITATFHNIETDDDENETITGIYKYKSAIMQSDTRKATETVNVESFPKAYKITYHRPGSTDYVEYYTSMSGYDLWEPSTYTWFTDEACTAKATAKLPGRASGNIDLYSSTDTNYHDVYVRDMTGNPVTIKTIKNVPETLPYISVKNGYNLEAYCGDEERLQSNYVKYDISREGYYIKGIYRDLEKTETVCTETSGSSSFKLSADETIYVEYAPIVTLKIVDKANPENIIEELRLYNNYYKLDSDYVATTLGGTHKYSNDNSVLVWKYYSSATDEESIIEKKDQYVTEAENIIYAELDVPHTLTVVDITATDKTAVSAILAQYKFCMRNVRVNRTDITTSYYSSGNYITDIADLYSDTEGKEVISFGTTLNNLTEDTTIYAAVAKKTILTLNYNTAYKLVVEGENTKLVAAESWYSDKDGNDLWSHYSYITTDSSYSRDNTYTRTVYCGPIDPTLPYTPDVRAEEVIASEVITPDVGHTDDEYMNVKKSDVLWNVYSYHLTQGVKYYINWDNQSNCIFYFVNPATGKCLTRATYDYSSYFIAPTTGNYEVYVSINYSYSNALEYRLHVYEDPYNASAVTVKTEGDIEIIKSEPDEETGIITLSTKYEYPSYQWRMGNRVLGTNATLDFDPSQYIAGETYQIVLTGGVLSSTITITIPEEEEGNE